jgi:hypothetical protein
MNSIGANPGYPIPWKGEPDLYVLPRAIVLDWMTNHAQVSKQGAWLYQLRRPFSPNTQEHRHRFEHLDGYLSRFDLIPQG